MRSEPVFQRERHLVTVTSLDTQFHQFHTDLVIRTYLRQSGIYLTFRDLSLTGKLIIQQLKEGLEVEPML